MKNILNKIYIHPLFIIALFVFVSIGYFRFLIYFMMLILVHELGHIIISLLFKWNIDRIIILPFGGLTKYNEMINRPLIEEFLIAISGVIFQFLFYLLIKDFVYYKYFSAINYFIILFNLIPIYPLDGSKILNIFFNLITTFKNSLSLTIIISYIFIIIFSLLFFNINKIIAFVIIFLLLEVNRLYKERKELFNKFLLERYLNEFKFKKKKTIKSVDKMKKDYRHLFYIDGKYLTEKYFLKKMFDIRGIL
ncbi:MAG: hypothetical protein IJE04_01775 [Bacilli bacterium]|nr:hypothetical protein [Bacilli bacterium]